MAAYNKFQITVADFANKIHNLGADALKVALSNTGPVNTNTILANITQISATNGYTAGGSAVSISSSSQSAGLYKLVASANTVFTAAGGSMGPFQYVVFYNSTPANGNLIGWWDYGAAVTITNGNTFTVQYDAANGILQIT